MSILTPGYTAAQTRKPQDHPSVSAFLLIFAAVLGGLELRTRQPRMARRAQVMAVALADEKGLYSTAAE
jgi:hypothetical protein